MRHVLLAAALVLAAAPASTDDDPHVKELMVAIKGKENRPAGEVFRNVKMLKEVPAGRFLKLMDAGYNRALGVNCEHCHVEDRWEADEKRAKRAAREMITLVREINGSLEQMRDIDTAEAMVNCTTCHRGFVKPALQIR